MMDTFILPCKYNKDMKISDMKNQKLFREIINSIPETHYIMIVSDHNLGKGIGQLLAVRLA